MSIQILHHMPFGHVTRWCGYVQRGRSCSDLSLYGRVDHWRPPLGSAPPTPWAEVPAGRALWSAVRLQAHPSLPWWLPQLSIILLYPVKLLLLLFFSSSPIPNPLTLSLFFNLIMESSTPPEQAAVLAAGVGVIFTEHVSVSRYRSTCGVNLAWRSRATVYSCVLANVDCCSVSQKCWNTVYKDRNLHCASHIVFTSVVSEREPAETLTAKQSPFCLRELSPPPHSFRLERSCEVRPMPCECNHGP